MTKSYPDELAEWVKSRVSKRRRRDEAAVAFLAVKADVEAAQAAGYALFTIWEHMSDTGKVTFSYETFRTHARRFIKAQGGAPAPVEAAIPVRESAGSSRSTRRSQEGKTPRPPGSASPATSGDSKTHEKPAPMPGFSFNAKPNSEDLL
ncbi:TraK family protein [Burkholderia cenocepacia]|uniref:TraK family protein n=1 Tax=Burkholderia cenocepacia TaxID=95486 RepID=UPI002ABE5031|nr:TraK family protein [Burkholderia cenocepacia]